MDSESSKGKKPAPGAELPGLVEPFAQVLERHGLELRRAGTQILQVNVGRVCNLACRHCHLEAGPRSREVMGRETMDQVIAFARRNRFEVIDITGGAPELVPHIDHLLEGLRPVSDKLLLRSNLTALAAGSRAFLIDLWRDLGVVIVASFPSLHPGQVESQRGEGVWEESLEVLKKLNLRGYGRAGTGLELDLVVNPTGAFLPAGQCELEKKFRRDLERKWGIVFNSLYTFANVPLGRFRRWLEKSGNLEPYLKKLAESFNPATIEGLMCRRLISVSWDGCLYDCDFNLAAGLPAEGTRQHVGRRDGPPAPGTAIATGDHCYACTAGSGFT